MFVGAKCRPADRQCCSTVITRHQPSCCASILPPHAPPVLGRSLSVSQAVGRAASLAYSAPLLGKPTAWLYPAAIPPHLCRGEPRQKCSGQPGGSRSGCWRRQCRNKSATDCAGASMPGSIRCRERYTAIQANEPSRLSPVRPSVHPSRPVSSAPLLRPDGLRSIPLRSPAAPTTPDRLPGHAPLRSASYGTARLLAATRNPLAHSPGDQETGQHHRPPACPSIHRQC